MNNLSKIGIIALSLLVLVGCKSDRDSNPMLQDPTTFVLNTPPNAANVIDLEHSKAIELTTSQPDYGFPVVTTYSVEVSLSESFVESFSRLLATSFTTARMDIPAGEVNLAVIDIWKTNNPEETPFPGEPMALYVRLKAAVASGGGRITSNIVKLDKVLGYYQEKPVEMPTAMHINGTVSDWKWEDSYAAVPVHSHAGWFWSMQYFGGASEMVLNAEADGSGEPINYANVSIPQETIDALEITTNGENNIIIGKAGWRIVQLTTTIEKNKLVYSLDFLEPNVYILGPAVGGFDLKDENKLTVPADDSLGDFASQPFPFDAPSDAGLRMCIKLDDCDWWQTEFMIFDGELKYRATGGDQDRVSTNAGQKAFVNFLKKTGRIE